MSVFSLAASFASKGASLALTCVSSTLGPISVATAVVASIDEALEHYLEATSALAWEAATNVVKTAAALCCCGATPDDGELVEVVEVDELVMERGEKAMESQQPAKSAAGVGGHAGKVSSAPVLNKSWAPSTGARRLEQNNRGSASPCYTLPSPPTRTRPTRLSSLKAAASQPPAGNAPRPRLLRSTAFKVERPFASPNRPAPSQEDGRTALPRPEPPMPSIMARAPPSGTEQSRTSLSCLRVNRRSNKAINERPATQTLSARVPPAATIKGFPWDLISQERKEWDDLSRFWKECDNLSGEDLSLALFDKLKNDSIIHDD